MQVKMRTNSQTTMMMTMMTTNVIETMSQMLKIPKQDQQYPFSMGLE